MGYQTAIWASYYPQLVAYRAKYGHLRIPTAGHPLSQITFWLRNYYPKSSVEHRQLLDELGYEHDRRKGRTRRVWLQHYAELIAYKAVHGNTLIPRTHPQKTLATWTWLQRQIYTGSRPGKLSREQVTLLNKIGFIWKVLDTQWLRMFQKAKAVLTTKERFLEHPKEATWVWKQLAKHRKGKLDPERYKKLTTLPIPALTYIDDLRRAKTWGRNVSAYVEFVWAHGNVSIPTTPEFSKLAHWVSTVRQQYRTGRLLTREIQQLKQLDFVWVERVRLSWPEKLRLLKQHKPSDKKVASLVNSTRTSYRLGKLTPTQIKDLESIGFEWRASSRGPSLGLHGKTAWDLQYQSLLAHKKTTGHCRVIRAGPNARLAVWVSNQRQSRKNGTLTAERIELLDEIGFIWDARSYQGDANTCVSTQTY